MRGSVEVYRANYREALAAGDRGVALAREIGARRFEAEGQVLRGLAVLGLGDRSLAQATLADAVALAREAARTYCGPWALVSLALASEDAGACRALLDEGEQWLAAGCVSHNYFEFYRHAIEVSWRFGDSVRAARYADALEAYTQQERLPWADLVMRWGRTLARVDRSAPDRTLREELDGVLAEARLMQFNELARPLARGSPS